MHRVAITGLGFVSCLGHDTASVLRRLRNGISGVRPCPLFEQHQLPCTLAGVVEGFDFPTHECEDWVLPPEIALSRSQLRTMAPHSLYGYAAAQRAIADAALTPELISHPRTGLNTSSLGSLWILHENFLTMTENGPLRFPPHGVTSTVLGSLNFNLATLLKIQGSSCGFFSACSSSAHAIGYAFDQLRWGKQDRCIVVGAEELNLFVDVPFMAIRATSTQNDPARTPAPFCKSRDGFIPTGGAAALVLERLDLAQQRGVPIYAELKGWGQTADGFNIMSPHPDGEGLARAMRLALDDAQVTPEQVDYLNAHATATQLGDIAELRAIKSTFPEGNRPAVSSTKSITGHGISMAGALEAAFTALALKHGFIPPSAHIQQLDEEAHGVPIITAPASRDLSLAISNSSGFGGTNVSLVLGAGRE